MKNNYWVNFLIFSIVTAAFTSYFEVTIDNGYLFVTVTIISYLKTRLKKNHSL